MNILLSLTFSISIVCNPNADTPECGVHAKCFVATKFCQLGRCACESSEFRPLIDTTDKNNGDCAYELKEGDYCGNADRGQIPENGMCHPTIKVVITRKVNLTIPLLFGEPCGLELDDK